MDMFIDGRWVAAQSGATFDVVDPATGETVDSVPEAGRADVDAAINAADIAFQSWKTTPVAERARLQRNAARLMRESAGELGRLLTRELGRPLAGAVSEIQRSAELLDVYAEEGLRLHAEMPLTGVAGEKIVITREPVGVVVAITPFNYPVTLLCFKLGAALMAGCTVVAKPAEDTPLSTLRLAELFRAAGFPDGCFNAVTGRGPDLGMQMIAHPTPRKIAFTGGTRAGKAIAAAAAGTMKRVTLELGGQCPAIVCADADIGAAAAAIARHAFANSGQFCYRVNRVYVERPIYAAFLAALADKVAQLDVGNGLTSDCALGPLINEKIYRNSERQIADARANGATVLTGGVRLTGGLYDKGWFLPPTVIADAPPSALVMTEETFGPVLGVAPFDDRTEALRLANATVYGLAAFVFSRNLATGLTLAERLEAGSVWVNDIQRSNQRAPFGGMKQSGIGREKGRYGIEDYLEYKTIYLTYDAELR
ncbi:MULTISPECIES: aldehyde dehydrogenase family protein [unclassified Bradyrhizobium]|uniref:aldehyde dehydrogenase family protein n=1 Tax=unclassified Bradyrhizobium TaxID=2631580 RepID=UPI0029164474|nr:MULTISPECIES: aldehyde dehydrogenase family protein [unclassified Bradyrhizobium]